MSLILLILSEERSLQSTTNDLAIEPSCPHYCERPLSDYENVVSSWIFGAAFFAITASPLCTFLVPPYHYSLRFEENYPGWTFIKVGGNALMPVMYGASFFIYMILVGFLVKQRLKMDATKSKAVWRETSILIYAATRFFCEYVTVFVYYFGASLLPATIWVEIIKFFFWMLESLFLSPMLLVIFSRSVREDAFPFLKDRKVVVAVTTLSIRTAKGNNRDVVECTTTVNADQSSWNKRVTVKNN
uniref:Serpentine Receptor, class T n=1 Tax=Steinernema glaseri TaxID=37863 RepID=A0A1I8AMD1_9BILA